MPNPCYKQDEIDKTLPKIWGKNLKTAVSEFNFFSKNAFFKSGSASASTSVTKCSSSVDPKVQTREPSAKRARVNSKSQSDSDDDNFKTQPHQSASTSDQNLVDSDTILSHLHNLTEAQNKHHQQQTELQQTLHQQQMDKLQQIMKSISVNNSSASKSTSVLQEVAVDSNTSLAAMILKIKHALSMNELLECALIKDDFVVREDESTMICNSCTERSSTSHKPRVVKFSVKDCHYVKDGNMPYWFKNLKRSLLRHLDNVDHFHNAAACKLLQSKSHSTKEQIYKLCTSLMYYTLHTNTAFSLYPVLLAVLARCNHEVGDINHTRWTVSKMLDLVADELKDDTRSWFNKEVIELESRESNESCPIAKDVKIVKNTLL